MKYLKIEIKLWLVSVLAIWISKLLPTDESASDYWIWLAKMPNELKQHADNL